MKTELHPHIEVILPVCNDVKNLVPFLREMDTATEQLKESASISYLFINDGSKDGSRELLHRLFRERSDLRVVDLIHAFGQSAAIACGLQHFDGDIAVLMEPGLPSPGTALVEMFAAWLQGSKTVVAESRSPDRSGLSDRAFDSARNFSLSGLPVARFSIPSLLDRTVADRLKQLTERGLYFPGLFSFASESITVVKIDVGVAKETRATRSIARRIRALQNALVGFSALPLRFISYLGMTTALVLFTFAGATLVLKALTSGIRLASPLIVTLLFFSSAVQLLAVGFIGQYVARVFEEVKQRPLYWVDRVLERKNPPRKAA